MVLSSGNQIGLDSEATQSTVGAFYQDSLTSLAHVKRPVRALGGQGGAGARAEEAGGGSERAPQHRQGEVAPAHACRRARVLVDQVEVAKRPEGREVGEGHAAVRGVVGAVKRLEDLGVANAVELGPKLEGHQRVEVGVPRDLARDRAEQREVVAMRDAPETQIGRASCRERV